MPFCPQCKSEYREGFETCAQCGVALVPALEAEVEPAGIDEAVEVFEARDSASAQRIRDVILHEIPSGVHKRSQSTFPVHAAMTEIIVVDRTQAERALAILGEAVEDGAITEDDGEILEEVDS
jgi:hypothetical protein